MAADAEEPTTPLMPVAEAADTFAAQMGSLLFRSFADAMADAWDEGVEAIKSAARSGKPVVPNPYRIERDDET